MIQQTKKTFLNPRLMAILFLGFASGLPFALTGSTLQAWFTEANINVVTIGTLSLLGLPYTFKFLWAPILDHYRFPLLGKRKAWILLTQLCLFLALLLLANMQPGREATQMGCIALMVAFFSATQDISINAYTTDLMRPEERGLGAAYTIFAYRVALLISGALALVMAGYVGWKVTYNFMAVLMLLLMIPTFFSTNPQDYEEPQRNLFQTTIFALNDLLQRDKFIFILLFIVLYKMGDALALSLITNFLLHGLGFSLIQVGLTYKVVSFAALILGGFIGGAILTRWNIYSALLLFGLAQAFSNLMFVVLAMVGKDFLLMSLTVFIENFCSGLSTAALFAFMMSLCNHRYTASQFALLSAAASLGRVFLGPLAGVMVQNLGWAQFYLWSFLLSLPSLVILVIFLSDVLLFFCDK